MNAAIIGCGYLGSKVALELKKRKVHVTATTRTPSRLEEIAQVAQKGALIPFSPDEKDFLPILEANDLILVSIAAGSMENYDSAYRITAQIFRQIAKKIGPKKLFYTSSTSVYGDNAGKWVDETSERLANTEQGKILIEAEDTYLSLEEYGWQVSLVRLAEIYGPGREISKKVAAMAGRPLPGNGHQYTNMVHIDDCVGGILYLNDHHLTGIYNLADEDHPLRKNFYQEVAQKHHLKAPTWDPALTGIHTGNKRVSIHKMKAAGYALRHPHRILD
jgi:nucleoside-diphosphate-sugar epimerase